MTRRAFRIPLLVFGAIVGLLFVAALAVRLLVDPNDYRETIERQFLASTGRELRLKGPLELAFWPRLAVRTGASPWRTNAVSGPRRCSRPATRGSVCDSGRCCSAGTRSGAWISSHPGCVCRSTAAAATTGAVSTSVRTSRLQSRLRKPVTERSRLRAYTSPTVNSSTTIGARTQTWRFVTGRSMPDRSRRRNRSSSSRRSR